MLHKEIINQDTLELLKTLQHSNGLKAFCLAGGTSLALQIGHRTSIDLDFFSINEFNESVLLPKLEKQFQFKLYYSAKNT